MAIYAQRACLDTIVIEKNGISGGQVLNTWEVDNYPGFPGVTGLSFPDSSGSMQTSWEQELYRDEVVQVELSGNVKKVVCEEETYEARCVILASGHITGRWRCREEELRGAGVSYCATCDGAFFREGRLPLWAAATRRWKMQFFLHGCVKKYISSIAETSFAGAKTAAGALTGA